MHDIKLVRAFDLAKGKARKAGTTVLVDALWARGIKKQNLPLDVSNCRLLSSVRRVQGGCRPLPPPRRRKLLATPAFP